MKILSVVLLSTYFLFLPLMTLGSEADRDPEILAKRGKGVVTQSSFAARADRIPEEMKYATLRNGNRFIDLLNSMLLYEQLAADAREAGFDKQKIVMDRMQLAANKELSEAWLDHYIETQPDPDYETLAYEYFLVHKADFNTPPTIDVSHILLSSKNRSDGEALEQAQSLRQQIISNPDSFDALVMEFSEDPSVASNKGKFVDVKRGDMVPEFDKAAFSLESGQISEPVKSGYGYHIIRLDAQNAPEPLDFDDVKIRIMDSERERHVDRIKEDYIGNLSSIPVDITDESTREMIRRIFGEEYLEQQNGDEKTE
jgi:peptidyl-prolyl cis-trans isomerase C